MTHRKSIHEARHDDLLEIRVFVEAGGKMPVRGSKEAAGWDLSANLNGQETIILEPRKPIKISSGVAIDFPRDCFGLLDVRSSFGIKGADLACRIIDSDYRNIISLVIKNDGSEPIEIKQGERIAQIVFQPYTSHIRMVQVESLANLSSTGRGLSGFGSSGKF